MAIPEEEHARDLDETRRLLYMSLLASRTKRYNLAGTLINALRHHQHVDEKGLEGIIISQVEGHPELGNETWIRDQIARITTELEAGNA